MEDSVYQDRYFPYPVRYTFPIILRISVGYSGK